MTFHKKPILTSNILSNICGNIVILSNIPLNPIPEAINLSNSESLEKEEENPKESGDVRSKLFVFANKPLKPTLLVMLLS
jgi:hypothetical protein